MIPDIVTMAKAAGNGQPLGFVALRRSVAEEFQRLEGSFFSSAGGCPVSCVTGIAVLRLLRTDNLQERARVVGLHLHNRLLALAERCPGAVGCIHGKGLYQGVELSLGGSPDAPAPSAMTRAICRRLLERGVVCHGTGDYSNVLKVKPPLCLSIADADHFVDSLEHVLTTGW